MAREQMTLSPRKGGVRFNSIFLKLAVGIGLAAAALTAITSQQYGRAAVDIATRELVHAGAETNELMTANLSGAIRFGDEAAILDNIRSLTDHDQSETRYAVASTIDGEVIAEHGVDPTRKSELLVLIERAIETGAPVASDDGLLVAAPAKYGDGIVGAFASAWTDDYVKADANAAHLRVSLMAYLTVAGGIVLLVLGLRTWIARPMTRLASGLEQVANGDLDIEIPAAQRGDELGDIGKVVETFRRHLAEGRESERKIMFRNAALDATSAAIMMVDADMNITDVNPAVVALMRHNVEAFRTRVADFDPDALVGTNMDAFHPGELGGRVRRILSDPANLPYEVDLDLAGVRITLRISAVTDTTGKVIGYVNQWRDETETYFNTAVVEAIEASMMKADFSLSGEVLHVNHDFARVFGRSADDGKPWENATNVSARMAEALARCRGGEADYDEFVVDLPGLETRILDGGFTPVTDRKGRVIRISFIGKDVTAAKRSIERAEAERAAAQAAQAAVVENLRGGLKRLAEGDLTARIDVAFAEDYEQLRADFNLASERLQSAMHGVVENAALIQGEANEISSAADDLSQRTERQAATLEETASALDELTSSVSSAAEGAAHANRLVDDARANAERSGEVVREAVGAMGEIESSSSQISKITGVIDDIAFQTNLLALNAGVEAARAGDAGRGFAVVASEVRALAQRSSDAAREINALISASGGHVKRGVELVDQTGVALDEIASNVREISKKVSEIAASAQEQSAGLAEINTAMNQLDQVTQQNAAMFEETTAATHALTREAETLTQTTARFRTGQLAKARVIEPSFASTRPTPAVAPPPRAPDQGNMALAVAAPDRIADDDGWDEF